jgi:hypothetical protein
MHQVSQVQGTDTSLNSSKRPRRCDETAGASFQAVVLTVVVAAVGCSGSDRAPALKRRVFHTELATKAATKIQEVTLMRPIHGNL